MQISSLWRRDHPSPTAGKVRFVSAHMHFDIPPVFLCLLLWIAYHIYWVSSFH